MKKILLLGFMIIISSMFVLAGGSSFQENTQFSTINSTNFNFDGSNNWVDGTTTFEDITGISFNFDNTIQFKNNISMGAGAFFDGKENTHIYSDGTLGGNGKLRIGPVSDTVGMNAYYDSSSGDIFFDQLFDSSSGDFRFRTRSTGTPVDATTILGTGALSIATLNSPGSDPLCWDGSGGSLIGDCSSLSKYKHDITYINPSYSFIQTKYSQIKPARYKWNDDYMNATTLKEVCDENEENCHTEYIKNDVYSKEEYGILADELANVHEALVGYDENGEVKNVRWFNLITFNVLAIQSILDKQQEQENRLDEIETDLCNQGLTKYC